MLGAGKPGEERRKRKNVEIYSSLVVVVGEMVLLMGVFGANAARVG